jgi:hypothetical protein
MTFITFRFLHNGDTPTVSLFGGFFPQTAAEKEGRKKEPACCQQKRWLAMSHHFTCAPHLEFGGSCFGKCPCWRRMARTECKQPIQDLTKYEQQLEKTSVNREPTERVRGGTCNSVHASCDRNIRGSGMTLGRRILVLTSPELMHRACVCGVGGIGLQTLLHGRSLNAVKLEQPPQLALQISQYGFLKNVNSDPAWRAILLHLL